MRRWRFALPILLFTALCAAGWAGFVWFRVTSHPGGEVTPGQSWTSPKGYRVELARYQVSDSLRDEQGKPKPAMKGTKWVDVQMQFHDLPPETGCSMYLAGPGRVRWSTAEDAPLIKGFTYCTQEGAGSSPLVHAIFQVPEAMLPQVRGVELDHTMQLRQPPLFLRP